MKTQLIMLDRDGVINDESIHYIKTPDEWHPIPGSLDAIAALNRAGFEVVIATNQSGVARGLYDLDMLHRIHEKLRLALAEVGGHISAIFFCPHHPDEACLCRKPQLGMFHQIQKKFPQVDFSKTFFIGDSWSDMQVAFSLPCKPILVLTGKGQQTFNQHKELANFPHVANLAEAVKYVLSEP